MTNLSWHLLTETLLDGLNTEDPNPVRYASSGPRNSSTPVPEAVVDPGQPSTSSATVTAAAATTDESGAGETVNTVGTAATTDESGAGETVNTVGGGVVDVPILQLAKNGPPYDPSKWELRDHDVPLELSPTQFIPNHTLLRDVKKSMDAGDYNMYRYTNMRNIIINIFSPFISHLS